MELKIERKVTVNVDGGYVTEYDDFYAWVESFDYGENALVITKDSDGEMSEMISYCSVIDIVKRSDFELESEYEKAIESAQFHSTYHNVEKLYDYEAEFVTNKDIYYVLLSVNQTSFLSKAFNLEVNNDVSFEGHYEFC